MSPGQGCSYLCRLCVSGPPLPLTARDGQDWLHPRHRVGRGPTPRRLGNQASAFPCLILSSLSLIVTLARLALLSPCGSGLGSVSKQVRHHPQGPSGQSYPACGDRSWRGLIQRTQLSDHGCSASASVGPSKPCCRGQAALGGGSCSPGLGDKRFHFKPSPAVAPGYGVRLSGPLAWTRMGGTCLEPGSVQSQGACCPVQGPCCGSIRHWGLWQTHFARWPWVSYPGVGGGVGLAEEAAVSHRGGFHI